MRVCETVVISVSVSAAQCSIKSSSPTPFDNNNLENLFPIYFIYISIYIVLLIYLCSRWV